MKVVIHCEYGGFTDYLPEMIDGIDTYHIPRTHPELIKICSDTDKYKIVDIPDDAHFVITDCDGAENLYWSDTPIHAARNTIWTAK